MEQIEHKEFLEHRCRSLLQEKNQAREQLELVRSLSSLGGGIWDMHICLERLAAVCNRLVPFSAMSLYLVDDSTGDFVPSLFSPECCCDAILAEVEALIQDGSFSWALTQNAPHYSLDRSGATIVLQSLTCFGRVRGMFVGILQCSRCTLSDSSREMLNMALELGTAMLELSRSEGQTPCEPHAEEVFSAFFHSSVEGMFRLHTRGGFLAANQALAGMLGYDSPVALMAGVTDARTQVFIDPEQYDTFIHRIRQEKQVSGFQCCVNHADGGERWLAISARGLDHEGSGDLVLEGVARDITRSKHREEELARQANMDEITGIPNRTMFNVTLRRMFGQARRQDLGLSLLFIDLDRFKQINDQHGHQMGDKVLREVARRIHSRVRSIDLAARLGGDEFCVILHDVRSRRICLDVAAKLITAISQPIHVEEFTFQVGASIGIHILGKRESRAEDMIRKADKAMYRAKNAGKGSCFVHGDSEAETA